MNRVWILLLLLLGAPAHAGSFRWTQQGPEGGEARRLYVSPQSKSLWAIGQGLLFRNDSGTGMWHTMRLDLAGDVANDVAFDPTNEQRLYVATALGRVLRSTDGGKTFKGEFLVPGVAAVSVAVDPFQPTAILAGVLSRGAGGVFRSTDSGKTWTRGGLQGASTNFLYYDPDQSGHVFATSGGGDGGAVFESLDGGSTFTFLGINGGESDPHDIDYGSTNQRKNVFYAAVRGGVVKSVDGGRRWLQTGLTENASAIARGDGILLAATLRGLYLSRNNGIVWAIRGDETRPIYQQRLNDMLVRGSYLYLASRRSGIVRSQDLGESYEGYSRGLFAHSLVSMDVDESRGHVLVGSSAGSGVYRRDALDKFRLWTPVGLSLNLSDPDVVVALDRKNPDKLYAGIRSLGIFGVSRSEDRGQSWIDMRLNLPGLPIALGLHPAQEGPDKLVALTSQGTFQFRQELNAWVQLFGGAAGVPQSIAFDPAKPNRILLGTTSSLFRSDDGGVTFGDLTGPLREVCRVAPGQLPELCVGDPATLEIRVRDIALDPSDSNRVYVSFFRGGVWLSQKSGVDLGFYFAFRETGTNRILEEVTSIAVRPGKPQEQYFGTSTNGVFRTNGNTLEAFNENLVYPRVQELAFDRRDPPTLYARLLNTGVATYTFGPIDEVATFVPVPRLFWGTILLLALGLGLVRRSKRISNWHHICMSSTEVRCP